MQNKGFFSLNQGSWGRKADLRETERAPDGQSCRRLEEPQLVSPSRGFSTCFVARCKNSQTPHYKQSLLSFGFVLLYFIGELEIKLYVFTL